MHSFVPKILSVPVTEVGAIVLGPVQLWCFYTLLAVIQEGSERVGFATTLIFTYLGGLMMAGLAVHATSLVVIRSQFEMSKELYLLAMERLHRLWSHHLFQIGYFGLKLLAIWIETSKSMRDGRDVHINEKESTYGLTRKYLSSFGKVKAESTATKSPRQTLLGYNHHTLQNILISLWMIIMSIFNAIFAALTRTVTVMTVFNVAVLGRTLYVWLNVRSHNKRPPSYLSPDLYIFTITVRNCILGIFLQVIVYFFLPLSIKDS